jgi:hypothetical protein
MFYEFLNKIKGFFTWLYDTETHVEIWDTLGPI